VRGRLAVRRNVLLVCLSRLRIVSKQVQVSVASGGATNREGSGAGEGLVRDASVMTFGDGLGKGGLQSVV
jgi:hypothetical protein